MRREVTVWSDRTIRKYLGGALLYKLRTKVAQSVSQVVKNNNVNMAKALLTIAEQITAELAPVVANSKQPKAAKDVETNKDIEDDLKEELNFSSREEMLTHLGLPESRKEADSSYKKTELVGRLYSAGNEDALEDLDLPTEQDDFSMKKGDLLTIIYGE